VTFPFKVKFIFFEGHSLIDEVNQVHLIILA